MLFPSNEFLLFFLPVALILFLFVRHFAGTAAVVLYLLIASLVFYAYTNPLYVPLILASMTFNYAMAQMAVARMITPWFAIAFGVSVNLAVLGWFKYSAFIAGAVHAAFGVTLPAYGGELPLAVSFFTFLQIAYLVDVCTGRKQTGGIFDYFLFVTFFPHLIAGPLVHHGELIPQFKDIGRSWRRWQTCFAVGLTIFAVGLFKKIVIADNIAPFADLVFDGAKAGQAPALIQSWVGTLAYALQIYFDFSGYSDMAIGLSKMFCLKLPINFNSPYQATSIIDFWKRWHITLSRFLRDYLYIPLGGGRVGSGRRYANVMIVMLLGGLWHGAGWQFIFWGGLHGIYLVINHVWRSVSAGRLDNSLLWNGCAWFITLIAVLVAWVPFRAADLSTAVLIWKGMIGLNGITVGDKLAFLTAYLPFARVAPMGFLNLGTTNLAILAIAFVIAVACPNIYRIMRRGDPVLDTHVELGPPFRLQWSPTLTFAAATCALLFCAFATSQEGSPFLYFQF